MSRQAPPPRAPRGRPTEQARATAPPASQRLALLAAASSLLGASLDTGQTLQDLVALTVPAFADFAVLDLVDEAGQLRRHGFASGAPADYRAWRSRSEAVDYPPGHPVRRVLAERRSVLVARLSQADLEAFSPSPEVAAAARRLGLRSLLAVPLAGHGQILGVATFTRAANPRPFDADDVALAEQIAERAAIAVEHARLFARQREIALTLQRSLLPATLPAVEGLEVATRYLPGTAGTEVGGDWFDLIPLSTGRVGIVIGDVMGRGVTAAAVMGQLRAAARAYATLDLPPDEVLARLDDLVRGLDDPDRDKLVTCVYATWDPGSRRCCVANAGHLPPVVTGPRTALLTAPTGVPLGVGGAAFTAHELTIEPGQALVLYTDGLVEHRGRDLEAGMTELCALLGPLDGDLEAACDALLDALRPPGGYDDDVALLVIRVPAGLEDACVAELTLPANPTAAAEAREFTSRTIGAWGLGDDLESAGLLVSEVVTNAVRHSDEPVELRLRRAQRALYVEVADRDPRVPRPRRGALEDEQGRGLQLLERLTARWGARPLADGKVVWFEIPLPPGSR